MSPRRSPSSQVYSTEIANQEALTLDGRKEYLAELRALRRRGVMLGLRLQASARREREQNDAHIKGEMALVRERQTCERLRLVLQEADTRAGELQVLAVQKEQEAVAATAALARVEKSSTMEARRLASMIGSAAEEHQKQLLEVQMEAERSVLELEDRWGDSW